MHQDADADQDLFRFFKHQPVVCRQVRFAFHPVDDQAVQFFTFFYIELHVGGKGGPPQAHDPEIGDALQDFVRLHGDLLLQGQFDFLKIGFILKVRANDNTLFFIASGIDDLVQFGNRTRHRGVDVGGDNPPRPGDDLTRLYLVLLGYGDFGRDADVLRNGHIDHFGDRHPPDRFGGGQFILRRMYPSFWERPKHRFAV